MPQTSDAIIIGGGLIGCASALHLAQRGMKVTVLEKETVGAGGTGRSSAIVRQHYSNELTARMALHGLRVFQQFDEMGGKNLEVRYVEVAPFSEQADEAEHFGIEPVEVMTEVDGRRSEVDVYLGAVVISSYDKVVVPFFGKGLPIEYELTRSVQTVANEDRHKVGILANDANVIGGSREWRIVTDVLTVTAVKFCHPVVAFITMITGNRSFHARLWSSSTNWKWVWHIWSLQFRQSELANTFMHRP